MFGQWYFCQKSCRVVLQTWGTLVLLGFLLGHREHTAGGGPGHFNNSVENPASSMTLDRGSVVEGPGEGTSSYLPGSRHLLPGPAISLGILLGSTVHIQDWPLTTGVDKHCPSSEFPYFTLTPFLTAFISLTFPRALILGSHPDHTCMF